MPEGGSTRVVYKEGVFVGYRGYERSGIKPRFVFGHGLSYTTFRYRNLSIRAIPAGAQESGSSPRYEVSCDVTNTGKRDGADVAEVYVGDVHPPLPHPVKQLRGFARQLESGRDDAGQGGAR